MHRTNSLQKTDRFRRCPSIQRNLLPSRIRWRRVRFLIHAIPNHVYRHYLHRQLHRERARRPGLLQRGVQLRPSRLPGVRVRNQAAPFDVQFKEDCKRSDFPLFAKGISPKDGSFRRTALTPCPFWVSQCRRTV